MIQLLKKLFGAPAAAADAGLADTAGGVAARTAAVPVDSAVGEVLTDDYNPLEHYQLPKSERYRAMVAEILGPDWMLP